MYRCKLSDIPGFNVCLSDSSSEEALVGAIKCVTREHETNDYKIISYVKDALTDANMVSTYGALRSVIVNSLNNVVCFSPPKSTSYEDFVAKYPLWETEDGLKIITSEEYVEGTMVNVFYDPSLGEFVLSTKNTIGAKTSFFVKTPRKTFSEMFGEAALEANLDINLLDTNFCYSFVVQHPENRLVTAFEKPVLHLIAVYEIETGDNGLIAVSSVDMNIVKNCDNLRESGVLYLRSYDSDCCTTYHEACERFACVMTPQRVQGVVFRNIETGERCKMRNPNFEQVRRLRGNQPKGQFHYLTLRAQGKVGDFLGFYPEFSEDFLEYRKNVHQFSVNLLSYYSECYIKKMAPLMSYPKQYRTHMFNLSTRYATIVKPAGGFINKHEVVQYVNNMKPEHLMYALNYEHRPVV